MKITWHEDYRLNLEQKKTAFAFFSSALNQNPKPGTLETIHHYDHTMHAKQTQTRLPAKVMLAGTCFPGSFSQ